MSTNEEEKPYTIEQRDQIETYAGQNGHVVIKQISSMSEDDSMIFVHPEDVDKLITHLKNAKEAAIEIRAESGE